MSKLVMDEECRTIFCDIVLYDVELSVWQSAHLRDHAERETSQFCSTTRRGLISHLVKTHGFCDPVQRGVITNECPWCRPIFSTRLDPQHHACSSIFARFLSPHAQSVLLYFSSVSDYYDHIARCHLSLPDIPRARFARVAQFRSVGVFPRRNLLRSALRADWRNMFFDEDQKGEKRKGGTSAARRV